MLAMVMMSGEDSEKQTATWPIPDLALFHLKYQLAT